MSLQTRLNDLVVAIATDYKQLRTWMTGSASGDLTALTTVTKTSIVAAINEVQSATAGAAPVAATETAAGVAELATTAEVAAGTDDARIVTPAKFAARLVAYAQPVSANLTTLAGVASGAAGRALLAAGDATQARTALSISTTSETNEGLSEVATTAEVTAGTDDLRTISPLKLQQRLVAFAQPLNANLTALASTAATAFGRSLLTVADAAAARTALGVVQATETVSGLSEVATTAEVTAGTDDLRQITPLKLQQRLVAFAQPLNANLTTLAGVVSGAFGRTLLGSADAAAARTSLGLAAVAASGNAADLTGTLPTSALPALAINETFTAASQAAMLALTAQRGDVAIRTDQGSKMFLLVSDSPSTLADWKPFVAAGDVTSVAGRTGAVVLTKADVGLANVDNTSSANAPVSTAQQTAIDLRLAKAANLSDLGSVSTARTNLSVYSRAELGDPETDLAAVYFAAKAAV